MFRRLYIIALALCVSAGGYALSGYGISEAASLDTCNPVLHLISPVGGEQWYFWNDWNINWGIIESNPDPGSMELSYSLNSGFEFISLGDTISISPPFVWDIPEIVCHTVKVRAKVKDTFGNSTTVTSGTFSIDFEPPSPPQEIDLSIANDNSVVLLWSPVTTTVLGNPMAPDGYIILFSHDPDADLDDYTFLAAQKALSYTHNGVANFFDKMFYRIVAFINYDETLDHKLALLTQDPNPTWSQVKNILYPAGDNK